MARKPTDKQLFKMKNEWLGQFYEEVKPKDFYRAVFPEGSFEREGHPEDEKCNGVLTVIEGEKARNYIVFDELNMVDEVKGAEFAIMSPVGYSGRNRTAKNARWLYGIAVDLDGVEMEQLRDVFHQMKHDFLPQCTYCVNSGHGLHLYYLFEKPVPLYRHLQDQLREFKYELIRKIWNRYTSTYTEREQVQYQGIFQGFRMVGTQSKLGKRYPVTAFETGERVTVEYLNDFLMDDSKAVTDFKYKSDLSLAEAKKKYPEWYEKRIVRGEKKGRWHIKRDLYDWWLRKIQSGAVSVGHRYWCLSVLASYGIKCDIPEDEFERNARTAEAEQSKRAASRVKPTEPDRAGKQSAQRSVGDVERELRGIDEAVKSRTSKGRAEQAERRRAEQEAHQRAEAERRATEEQQRIASRRYIGRGWEFER